MNDTVLGALIAGGCGVLTAVVGGLIKCFLDVRAYKREQTKIKEERDSQKDTNYLEKRIAAYEAWIAHASACITFLTAVAQQPEACANLVDGQKIWDRFWEKQANCMASLKMFAHPKVYAQVEAFVLEFNKLSEINVNDRQTHLTRCGQKIEEIASQMRHEVNQVLCGKEEICV